MKKRPLSTTNRKSMKKPGLGRLVSTKALGSVTGGLVIWDDLDVM